MIAPLEHAIRVLVGNLGQKLVRGDFHISEHINSISNKFSSDKQETITILYCDFEGCDLEREDDSLYCKKHIHWGSRFLASMWRKIKGFFKVVFTIIFWVIALAVIGIMVLQFSSTI